MLSITATLAVAFVAVCLFGYGSHRFLHSPKSGSLYRMHKTHHTLYSSESFFSETYRSAGKDNSSFLFGAMSIPLLLLPIVLHLLGTMSLGLMLATLGEMLFLGWLHDYLHDAFHITGHWLNRFALFRKWIGLHIRHHQDTQTNFGIFSFVIDKLFGSFSDAPAIEI
jgi:sterol desaturase/sphingolipid hydroxylase (fatty acid hydroxylase superfamily)